MTQIRCDEITSQIHRDFLYNELDFALNRYAEILPCDPSTLQRWFLAFRVGPDVDGIDRNRRYRAAAQQYMSLRASMMVKELLNTPLIERYNTERYVSELPKDADINFVGNPDTVSRFESLYKFPTCRKVGLVKEDSVRVNARQSEAEFIVPDGTVLIVSRRCFRDGIKGSIPYAAICFHEPEEMIAMTNIGISDSGAEPNSFGVLGRCRAIVQGYCGQFRIEMSGEIKTSSNGLE